MKPHNPPSPSTVAVYREPPRSGNEVNGRGIAQFFKPRHVFHSTPGYYGLHEWWLMNRFFMAMASWRALPQSLLIRWHIRKSDGPVATRQQSVTDPAIKADEIKRLARTCGAGIVGITKVTEQALYEHSQIDYPNAIVIGMAMDRDAMADMPHEGSAAEVLRIYKDLAISGAKLAAAIRAQGWRAKSFADSMATDVMHIPLAVQAGLGTLGKHGSLICREYGSNVRLASVLTDMPLAHDGSRDDGIDDLCLSCQRCTIDCPPKAISDKKQTVRGLEKWYVDFDKCVPYFSITGGCAICIQVCPFSEPGRGFKLSEQLLRKRSTQAQRTRAA